MASEGRPVEVACRVLGVSTAGFYAWRSRGPSARSVRHAWLTDVMRQIHAASYGTYGGRRVHAELTLGRQIGVGYNTVALLMRAAELRGRTGNPCARHIRASPRPLISSTGASPERLRTSSG